MVERFATSTRLTGTAARIAEAAAAVVARQGFDALSVRTVAAAAGLAPGTVQHHFRTRELLIAGAMDHVTARQLERIAASPQRDSVREAIRSGVMEILPLSPDRREEAIVWLALATAAATYPPLRPARDRMVELFRGIVIDALRFQARQSGQDLDDDRAMAAAIAFAATIDGLMLHAIDAGSVEQGRIIAAVELALDYLLGLDGDK